MPRDFDRKNLIRITKLAKLTGQMPHVLAEYYNAHQWEYGFDIAAYEIMSDSEKITTSRRNMGVQNFTEEQCDKMVQERNAWMKNLREKSWDS